MAYIAIAIGVVALAIMLERLLNGTHIEGLFYNRPIKVGDKMHVYLDGVYNRTATVSKIEPYRVFIYDKLPLHIGYRGRFYATGLTPDGRHLVYVSNRNHFRYVRLAELMRVVFAIGNNAYMLEPNSEAPQTALDAQETDTEEEAGA